MRLKDKEELAEALIELKQSQEREKQLAAENQAILDAISSITGADNKHHIFHELKRVLSLHIDFSDFVVLSRTQGEDLYRTFLTSNSAFVNAQWEQSPKFERVLDGECTILFEPNKLQGFSKLNHFLRDHIQSVLLTGIKTTISESVILLLGAKKGQFSLETRDTLSRFRPLLERAIIDIEQKESLKELVELRTQELKLAQQKAETANEAKSRFLAMMSHELRTPLNTVLGFIDLLQEDIQTPRHLEALDKMEISAELLLVLINDILDLTRIESGNFPIQKTWVELHSKLSVMLEHFSKLARDKGLEFHVDLSFSEREMLWVDPTRVIQIVFNLVGNAVKFTEQGYVSIKGKLDNDVLRISVADSGIGIERDRLEHLFTPFKQADSSITRMYGGSGLGLSITKHLTTLMNGDISVSSVKGKGSQFSVSLPVVSKPIESSPIRFTPDIELSSNLNVLVVEDTYSNQMVIKLLLERSGYNVITLNNGQEALDYLKGNIKSVDLILMDMSMPIMDGVTATRHIRKLCNITPVIALTAHAMECDKQKCLDAGMNAFVSKPIRSKEIHKAIKMVVS
ncbi:response regulator [Vibrio sp. SCSIO 43135]|uniref:response regulator n=1 Tax=Vibrio sp. SCSIO 43135 TaxID=2819096 RepID=UPI002074E78E|nr:response regulator [Vibrio sp. SCSIO 43135]USD42489.1 response regulator [Vibrio sp. SCSIO 43135]